MGTVIDKAVVELEARMTTLPAGLRKGEAEVDRSVARMRRSLERQEAQLEAQIAGMAGGGRRGKKKEVLGFEVTAAQQQFIKFVAAFAIMDRIGRGLNHTFDTISQNVDDITRGTVTWRNAVRDIESTLLGSIPGFGQFFQLGQKIRAELDGSAAAMRKINREMEELEKRSARMQKRGTAVGEFNRFANTDFIDTNIAARKARGDSLGSVQLQRHFDLKRLDVEVQKLRQQVSANFTSPSQAAFANRIINQFARDKRTLIESEFRRNIIGGTGTIDTAIGRMRVFAGRGAAQEQTNRKIEKNTGQVVTELKRIRFMGFG